MVKAKKDKVYKKEVEDGDTSSSSDTEANDVAADSNVQVFSRLEMKARKQILKHGLKQVEGIVRVTLCRLKSILIVICNPEVYKYPNSDTYIVFGQIKVEDINSQAQLNAAQQLTYSTEQNIKESSITEINNNEARDVEVDLDESGLQQKDIELVMDQTKVSRSRAIEALRENDGDIVNAIMSIAI